MKSEAEQLLQRNDVSFFSKALAVQAVQVSIGWIKAFQLTRGQPHILQVCWEADSDPSSCFKTASVKDIREGGSAGLLAVGTLPNHGKKLCSASIAVSATYDLHLLRQSLGYRHFWLPHCPGTPPQKSWLCTAPIHSGSQQNRLRVRIWGDPKKSAVGPLLAYEPTLRKIQ